jgi:hypothetical protein
VLIQARRWAEARGEQHVVLAVERPLESMRRRQTGMPSPWSMFQLVKRS